MPFRFATLAISSIALMTLACRTAASTGIPRESRTALAGRWLLEVGPRWFYVPGVDHIRGFTRGASTSADRIHVSTNTDTRKGKRQ